ncbi:hypothetical protein FHS52_001262 [Erythromicrobium ramosum]|uniref:DUF2513 domain-containing protein n=2 Tax=Erythrobacter ramosus TaxID=35811 RepID=A0A6I4UIA1_9SPHN|nr:hypothetical protein [Erythrobacter ramosus]MXP37059.1 DUF2513 domain-containing protein [Erythrobacter ramosus]
MKRDMDLVRDILLAVEAAPMHLRDAVLIDGRDPELVKGHTHLLVEAGLLRQPFSRSHGSAVVFSGLTLTWDGHEFLETIRDGKIWEKTKSGAGQLGSWSIGLMGELAKGAIRQKAAEIGLALG